MLNRTFLGMVILAACSGLVFGCSGDSTSSPAGTDKTDSTNTTDSTDKTDSTDTTDSTDSTGTTDATDNTGTTDMTDNTDHTGTTDMTDNTDMTDTTDMTDMTDITDMTDVTDMPEGACINEQDGPILEAQDVSAVAEGCGIDNIGDAAAAQKCIQDETGITDGCAACFGGIIGCIIEKCIAQCGPPPIGAGPDSPECGECRAENCDPAFEECSGVSTTDDG